MQLSAGQNTPLPQPDVTVTVTGPIDVTALVCDATGKVSGDADMVFFNQPSAPGVQVVGNTVTVQLAALRAGATKVVLVASPADQGATFGQLPALTVTANTSGEPIMFSPDRLSSETALVLCELYSHNGQWKLRAVGQGYATGLAGVATDYGIQIDDAAPTPPAAPPPPPVNMTKVPLGKVTLQKNTAATISLVKEDKGNLILTSRLLWKGRGGGLPADLDLYALFIDDDGRDGVVYYRNLGSLTTYPYIALSGDSVVPGEEIVKVVAGHHRYVLIAAYSAVENGVGSFYSYQAQVVVDDGAGSEVSVPLYFDDPHSYWVAITLMDFTDPSGVKVTQLEQYGKPESENRPLLKADGRVLPSAGPVEFKTQ